MHIKLNFDDNFTVSLESALLKDRKDWFLLFLDILSTLLFLDVLSKL